MKISLLESGFKVLWIEMGPNFNAQVWKENSDSWDIYQLHVNVKLGVTSPQMSTLKSGHKVLPVRKQTESLSMDNDFYKDCKILK